MYIAYLSQLRAYFHRHRHRHADNFKLRHTSSIIYIIISSKTRVVLDVEQLDFLFFPFPTHIFSFPTSSTFSRGLQDHNIDIRFIARIFSCPFFPHFFPGLRRQRRHQRLGQLEPVQLPILVFQRPLSAARGILSLMSRLSSKYTFLSTRPKPPYRKPTELPNCSSYQPFDQLFNEQIQIWPTCQFKQLPALRIKPQTLAHSI